MKNRLGVCSWSLQPASPEELVERIRTLGLDGVQLALDPLRTGEWSTQRTTLLLQEAGIGVRSGMMGTLGEDYSTLASIKRTGGVVPDEHWEANLAAAGANARLAEQLKLDLVSLHAGFLPEEPGEQRDTLIERLRAVAGCFAEHGIRTAFETGQEHATTLLEFLAELDHPKVGVNFDPANMILYDKGDPIEALEALAPYVFQIHIKDARRTHTPGTWGSEETVGTGEVDWRAFFSVLRRIGLDCDLMIEREAGTDRSGDIATARRLVEEHARPGSEFRKRGSEA